MWLIFSITSAALLGCYDVFKKRSLLHNAVFPVLLLNTFFCTLIFLPIVILNYCGIFEEGDAFYILDTTKELTNCSDNLFYNLWSYTTPYLLVLIKSFIVLGSWICGYYSIKHLPLTIVGPINATRPVMVLIGAVIIYGETLNQWQWLGVSLAILSFYLLSRTSKREGIYFSKNKWIVLLILSAILGATSGLYDKYLLQPTEMGGAGLNFIFVQSWFNIFQFLVMSLLAYFIWWRKKRNQEKFIWKWDILCISVFLTMADMAYFYALSTPGAMISIISMIRRSSVLISFACGYFLFREKNIKSKIFDLILVLLSVICLYIGSN